MHLILQHHPGQRHWDDWRAEHAGLWTGWGQVLASRQAAALPAAGLEEDDLDTPARRAWLELLAPGQAAANGLGGPTPTTAWERLRHDLPAAGAWATLSPVHGVVGSDQITLLHPRALALSEHDSRAFFEAVQPLFHSEGVHLEWFSPRAWHVQHPSLAGLACAALERAVGGSMQQWQSRTPLGPARLLRRLQNEAQMALHQHPLNAERAERGLLAVNSLWLDGAGALPEPSPERPQATVVRVELEDSAEALTQWTAWEAEGRAGTLVLAGPLRAVQWSRRPPVPAWRRWWPGASAPTAPVPLSQAWEAL